MVKTKKTTISVLPETRNELNKVKGELMSNSGKMEQDGTLMFLINFWRKNKK